MSRLCFDERTVREIALAAHPLADILADWLIEADKLGGPSQWIVSSIFRSPSEEHALRLKLARNRGYDDDDPRVQSMTSGIHMTYRAVDLFCVPWDQMTVDQIAELVNARWVYDPHRLGKQVIYAAPHGSGRHVHVQVHPHTIRRTELLTPDDRRFA